MGQRTNYRQNKKQTCNQAQTAYQGVQASPKMEENQDLKLHLERYEQIS